jgi:hypothetical protein
MVWRVDMTDATSIRIRQFLSGQSNTEGLPGTSASVTTPTPCHLLKL